MGILYFPWKHVAHPSKVFVLATRLQMGRPGSSTYSKKQFCGRCDIVQKVIHFHWNQLFTQNQPFKENRTFCTFYTCQTTFTKIYHLPMENVGLEQHFQPWAEMCAKVYFFTIFTKNHEFWWFSTSWYSLLEGNQLIAPKEVQFLQYLTADIILQCKIRLD